ncbi:MAG TPA: T9SS type A sorting domain-containing protein [Saprospiraceae bacterium]|nr:T9SS type A sorting domain-containing protein [Saprospiraceae bacterium]
MKKILTLLVVNLTLIISSVAQKIDTVIYKHINCYNTYGSLTYKISGNINLYDSLILEDQNAKSVKIKIDTMVVFDSLKAGKYILFAQRKDLASNTKLVYKNMQDFSVERKSISLSFSNPGTLNVCNGVTSKIILSFSENPDSVVYNKTNFMGFMNDYIATNTSNTDIFYDTIIARHINSNCSISDTLFIQVKPSPRNDLIDVSNNICSGEVIKIVPKNNSLQYKISFNSNPNLINLKPEYVGITTQNSEPIINTTNNNIPINFSYYYIQNGCNSISVNGQIVVNVKPEISMINDVVICSGSSIDVPLKLDNLNGSEKFTYAPLNIPISIVRDTNKYNPILIDDKLTLTDKIPVSFFYNVFATFDNGCKDTTMFQVKVNPIPGTPNTPNNQLVHRICINSNYPELLTDSDSTQWSDDQNFISFKKGKSFQLPGTINADKTIYFRSQELSCNSIPQTILLDALNLPIAKINEVDEVTNINGFDKLARCIKVYNGVGSALGEPIKFKEFSWMASNGKTLLTNDSSDKFVPKLETTGKIILKVTDENGCFSSIEKDYNFNESCNFSSSKKLGFKNDKIQFCQGAKIELTEFPVICINSTEGIERTNTVWNLYNRTQNIRFSDSSGFLQAFNPVFILGDSCTKYSGEYRLSFKTKIVGNANLNCEISDELDFKVTDLPNFFIHDSIFCKSNTEPKYNIVFNPILKDSDNEYTLNYRNISDNFNNIKILKFSNKLILDSLILNDNLSDKQFRITSVKDKYGCASDNDVLFKLLRRDAIMPTLTSNLPICQGDSLRLKDTNLAVNQIAGWNNKQKAIKIVDPMTISIGTSIDSFGCQQANNSFDIRSEDLIKTETSIGGAIDVCRNSKNNIFCAAKLEKDVKVNYVWKFNSSKIGMDSCQKISLTETSKDSFVLELLMTTLDTFGDKQCHISARKKVVINTTNSRDTTEVKLWPGNLLVSSDNSSKCYKWIRTDKLTNIDSIIGNCDGKQACAFKELDFEKYSYSVQTSGYDSCFCSTLNTFIRSASPKVDTPIKIILYPNPTGSNSGLHLISAMEDHGLVEIYNVMGQLILQANHKIEVLKNEIQIPSEQFQSGVYFVKLKLMNQETETIFKLVKE